MDLRRKTMWALTMLTLLGCAPPEQSAAPSAQRDDTVYHWKLITTWPKNLPAVGTAPERLAQMVDKMSRGRLKIKVYGAGELVPAFGVFDAVSSGTAEMGHGAAYYWRGKIPIAAIFSTVPFGLTADEMNAWLYHGGGMELWRELYAPFGLIPMASGNTGVQMAGWFNKEINSIADIKGLKMRIPGLGGEVFQRAGGVAVALPGGEIFTALQTGTIDATEWVGPYNDRAFGLHTVAKYYYYPGWHEPGATLEAIVNKKAFEALPEDLRVILETASRAINEDMLDELNAQNSLALKDLVENHHVEVRRLPDDVLQRFKEISREVVAEAAEQNELSRRIYRSFEDFRQRIVSYDRIAEQAYIDAR